MASYADARAAHGEWLVRIEDVDMPRAREGAADEILRGLERHGMAWDGEVVRQSTRTRAYEDALEVLAAKGMTYGCACTRTELLASPRGERVYPGRCRDGVAVDRIAQASSIRVRVHDTAIAYVDRVFGRDVQWLAQDVGDFVVRRSDGLFAYQLAVVVDDAAQGVTDVVRGADLLTSTPRQIFLQRALGLPTPRYMHVPVAVDMNGEKLSKSVGSAALPQSPMTALVAAWEFLGQRSTPASFASPAEFWRWAIAHWQPQRIARAKTSPAPPPFGTVARV
jgi:glutamyl-Q tRNA(Asp) synthetase